ncbi:hypothetical protein ACFWY6_18655 [Streptomyces sp. NPDC059037]|uniref:hypothetical protein n=1 Tax=Streptomyces sp. NPDC059037 TaxID=3346710 RepID=UPI003695EA8E
MRIPRRAAAVLSCALLASAGVGLSSSSASAAGGVTFKTERYSNGVEITAYSGSTRIGYTGWRKDYNQGYPGDTLCVGDNRRDAKNVTGWASTGKHKVKSAGHTAPFRKCVTKNVPENRTYKIKMCVNSSSSQWCSKAVRVTS